MIKNNYLLDYLALAFTPKIGHITFIKLLEKYKNIENIISLSNNELNNIIGFPINFKSNNSNQYKEAELTLNWLAKNNNCKIVTLLDKNYPLAITNNTIPPPFLFLKGNINLLNKTIIAIVGSRNPTIQAKNIAFDFAQKLSSLDHAICSGLALGIDTCAHEGALLEKGSTIAIIGTGIDKVYPKKNEHLEQIITNKGLVISEFKLGITPNKFNFPRRNRLIAALSQSTLVVEATLKSGALITARLAGEMGKEVMAIPGSILNQNARGCHKLIKEGAKLVEDICDIVDDNKITNNTESLLKNNNNISSKVLDNMGFEPIYPDEIASIMNIPIDELFQELIILEMDGYIKSTNNGKFQRIK